MTTRRQSKPMKQARMGRCIVRLDLEGDALPTEFRIWKVGINTTANGYDVLWDEAAATATMAAYQKHGVDLMIDLNHLSLDDKAPNYDPDARGWCQLELRNGELWAVNVRWTPDGAERLRNKKQRYTSPAFRLDEEMRCIDIFNVALVGMPGTDELPALIAANRKPRTTMANDFKTLSRVGQTTRKLHKSGVAPGAIIKTLAEGDATGEVAGVDIAALADFLNITTDPAQDPAGFVRELMSKLEEISGRLRGDAAEPAGEGDPNGGAGGGTAEMAAASRAVLANLRSLTNASNDDELVRTISDWRGLAVQHAAEVKRLADERKALEDTKRRTLVAEYVVAGIELPSTAWADDAKTIPAAHLAGMTIEQLERRLAAFKALNGSAPGKRTPAAAPQSYGLTPRELEKCKAKGVSPEAYAKTKAAMFGQITEN